MLSILSSSPTEAPTANHRRTRSSPIFKTTTASAPGHNKSKLDYKLENARQRFEGSFDALISYLARQGGVNPLSLQMVKQSIIHQSTAATSRQHRRQHHHHNSSSNAAYFIAELSDEELGHSSYARKCVEALTQLHQFAECVDEAPNGCELKRLILMTAWESLARYLQLLQKRLEKQYHKNALLCSCQPQYKEQPRSTQSGPRSRSSSPSEQRGAVSRQSLNQLSEAVVSCQKEWILLQNHSKNTQ